MSVSVGSQKSKKAMVAKYAECSVFSCPLYSVQDLAKRIISTLEITKDWASRGVLRGWLVFRPTTDPAPRLGLTRDWERENDGRNKTKRKEGLEENKPKGKRRKEMDRRKKQKEPTKRDGRKGKMAISGRGARTE